MVCICMGIEIDIEDCFCGNCPFDYEEDYDYENCLYRQDNFEDDFIYQEMINQSRI